MFEQDNFKNKRTKKISASLFDTL